MKLETVFDSLREGLFRYYDTPFGLRSQELETERRRILDADGVAWRAAVCRANPRVEERVRRPVAGHRVGGRSRRTWPIWSRLG